MTDVTDMDLLDATQAGIFFVASGDLDTLDDSCRQGGSLVSRIDLDGCTDKADLLQRFAEAFDFPPTFGHNWDALEDSLGDLSWLPAEGYLLLLDHVDAFRDANETECDTLFDILDENSRTWADAGIAFFSFVAFVDPAFEADDDDNELPDDEDLLDDDDA